MKQEELQEILRKHELWVFEKEGGECANLYGANLECANLYGANLYGANLDCANLKRANLECANLKRANLECANLECANLYGANLKRANLKGANLYGANLKRANLYGANLECANLECANLYGANLYGANLECANLDQKEMLRKGIVVKRKMTGWKKCQNDIIVKLEIPKGAIVFSINNNKCRTNIAKVVDIIGGKEGVSKYDVKFIYRKGKTYKIKDFDLMYNVECSTGIHFFRTRKEAEAY